MIGVVVMTAAGVGATSAQAPTASIRLSAASAPGGTAGADQAAVSYVESHYPGSGAANVLVTSPDVEHGVPVYDIRIVAPSGATYVVHVQQSNDVVLSANLAEKQVTTPPVTTPPVTTPPVTAPPVQQQEPVQPQEPVQQQEPVQPQEPVQQQTSSGSSVDTQQPAGSNSSVDTKAKSNSSSDSTDKGKSGST
ncbi:MAG: hypothetical protein ACYCVS_12920, partial [Acidimicrobiales bacterium]